MHIVLYEPEIPQNTGNIARTCAATGTRLHLIEPLGFSLDDKHVKRAGLDYWRYLDLTVYRDWEDFLSRQDAPAIYPASTRASQCYANARYSDNAYLLFGPETRGLPEALIRAHIENAVRIPMLEGLRSLNLSNSVAILLYEALRQQGFAGLSARGEEGLSTWQDYL